MRALDDVLFAFLSDELVQLPFPARIPAFAAETVRPPARPS